MQVLKRTGEELSQGQSRLKELVERMKREEEEVDRDTAILQQKKVVASLLKDFSSLTFFSRSLRHFRNEPQRRNRLTQMRPLR